MSPPEVKYIWKKTVKPSNVHTATRIDLTPWDLYALKTEYIQMGLLYLKPKHKEEVEDSLVNHLMESLSRTLDYFYPLACRLASETHKDSTTSFFINCDLKGAEFIHATADVTVARVLHHLFVPGIVHSFFPLNGLISYDGLSKPLLAVQVTELTDGIFLGCSMNHTVADGASFWQFMNSWSGISRNMDYVPCLPHLKRWFLNDADCPIRVPSSKKDQFIEKHPPPPLVERFLNFTSQTIAKLKAKANGDQRTNSITSLQALLGHIWIAVTRVRRLPFNQEVSYSLAIMSRERLHPKMPGEYFGNSVQVVTATAKAEELLERGSGWAAWLLNHAVSSHNEAAIRTSWDDWVKKPVFFSRDEDHGCSLHTGSSPKFNMYGNDFGWGRPIGARVGRGLKYNGYITVFPGAVEGSVDVEACLLPHTLMALVDDQQFMESVNILPPAGIKSCL